MLTKPARRRGFTLIEILVVISLIAVLAALSVGALFRVRAAQQTSNTEGTLGKLDTLMMARWSAILTNAKNPPPEVISRCDGDKDRAVSLWTYAVLKNEFPESYSELVTININGATLQPRKIFTVGVQNKALNAPVLEQSAALFYAAIMDSGNRGTANTLEGLQQQVGTMDGRFDLFDTANPKKPATGVVPIFKDSWGNPILFRRAATNNEITSPEFSKPSTVSSNPLDPRGLLIVRVGNNWAAANRASAITELGLPATGFVNSNFIPTLISAGPDNDPGTAPYLGGAAGDSGNDNLLSYRRREGTRRD